MFPVDSSAPTRYVPPPPPPPPPPVVVKPKDTVESIAKTYQVTSEELARTNNITTTTALTPGQQLKLPANAVQPAHAEAPPLTPQQTTDAAAKAYTQALSNRTTALQNAPHNMGVRSEVQQEEGALVDQAKTTFDNAVKAEIAGNVAQTNSATPPQFRTPESQLIQQYGDQIAGRYTDPAIKSEVTSTVTTYQVQTQAQSLIPQYSGAPISAADKLKGIDLQGQPQAVVDQVLADPQVQQWIKQAATDIGKPYDGMGNDKIPYAYDQANDASGNLAQATDGLPPPLATALTQASMPTIQKISQLELGYEGSMVPFDSVQSVLAGLGNSDQANAVVQQVASAYADNPGAVGFLTRGGNTSELESTIVNSPGYGSAGNPSFAIALGNELQARGQTDNANAALDAAAQGVHDYLANNGGSPLKAYDAAHSAASAKDQQLAELMSKAGPLTDAQKQAFIKAYRSDPDNAKAYQADAQAAKNLAAYMQTNQSALIYAAGRNPSSAQQLYSAMKDLAQSGQGVTALQFAGYVQNDSAASKAFSKFSDYQGTFLPEALESAQGQLLVQDGGDTKSAGSQLLELADPVFKSSDGWDRLKAGYQALANGDTKLFNAAEFAEDYQKLGAAGKGWAVLSVMTSSLNGANADQISEMLNGFATAGGSIDEVGTGAVQALADAGKFGAFTASADAMAKFTAKFVPGLAVVASTAAFASDFSKAAKGNPAYALALAGDVFSVLGSVMETTVVGEVPGAVVQGIGFLLSAPFELVGSLIEGNKEQKEFQEEQVKYLQAAGIDKEQAEALATDGDAINAAAKQLNLSPEQAQQVLADHPEAFGQGAGYTQGVLDVVKACQIKPADVDGFLGALIKDDPNYLSDFFNQRVAASNSPTTPLSNSDNLVDQIGGGRYANAKAFVQAHAPDVFSADGTARRQADRDYEMVLSTGGGTQQEEIGNLLKSNHNVAYQAEVVKVMKDNNTLNNWVQQISTQYGFNGWPQAARSAILAAQGAGVVSAEQAQTYLNQLGRT